MFLTSRGKSFQNYTVAIHKYIRKVSSDCAVQPRSHQNQESMTIDLKGSLSNKERRKVTVQFSKTWESQDRAQPSQFRFIYIAALASIEFDTA
jgi:hypothetical protein